MNIKVWLSSAAMELATQALNYESYRIAHFYLRLILWYFKVILGDTKIDNLMVYHDISSVRCFVINADKELW